MNFFCRIIAIIIINHSPVNMRIHFKIKEKKNEKKNRYLSDFWRAELIFPNGVENTDASELTLNERVAFDFASLGSNTFRTE